MIIKTKIDWVQTRELSEEERERIEAKKAVLEDRYDPFEDEEDLFEDAEKNAIIDTNNNKLYVEISENKICLTNLLGGEYIVMENGSTQRVEERLYFKSTLEEIYTELTK